MGPCQERRQVRRDVRRERCREHAILDEVPVVGEQQCERSDVVDLQPDRHRGQERLGDLVVVEQSHAQGVPAFVEGDRGAHLVEHLDPRGEARPRSGVP